VIWLHGGVAWRSGSLVGVDEVTLHRARLALGWLTVFGGHTVHPRYVANSASFLQRNGSVTKLYKSPLYLFIL